MLFNNNYYMGDLLYLDAEKSTQDIKNDILKELPKVKDTLGNMVSNLQQQF